MQDNQTELLNRIKILESKLELSQIELHNLKDLETKVNDLQSLVKNKIEQTLTDLTNQVKQIQDFINNKLPQQIDQAASDAKTSLFGFH